MRTLFHRLTFTFFISFAFASLAGYATPVRTQLSIQLSQNPPDPPDTKTPQKPQRGGGTRPGDSKCLPGKTGLISITPKSAETTKEFATFWFYIPQAPASDTSFSFIILDERDNFILNSKNTYLSGTPGFISLNSPTLEIGKTYRWYFSLNCDRQNPEDRTSVEGKIQRIAETSTLDNPQERLDFYLKNNDWYNAFLLLAELRKADPNDAKLKADWEQLLRSQNLPDLVNQPIVPCCSLN